MTSPQPAGRGPGVVCPRHPDAPAVAFCVLSGRPVCAACRRIGPDGLSYAVERAPEEALTPGDHVTLSAAVQPEVHRQQAPTSSEPPSDVNPSEPGPRERPPAGEVPGWASELGGRDASAGGGGAGARPPAPGERAPRLGGAMLGPVPDAVSLSGERPLAWERPEKGDVRAFWRTVAAALASPVNYTRRIPWSRADLRSPLLFALLCGGLGHLIGVLFGGVSRAAPEWVKVVPGLAEAPPFALALMELPMVPLQVAVQLFIVAGLGHLFLTLAGGAQRPFEATFRIYAYAGVASLLIGLPIVGPFVALFLQVFLVLGGIREAHQGGLGRGLLGLAPLLLIQALGG